MNCIGTIQDQRSRHGAEDVCSRFLAQRSYRGKYGMESEKG